MSKKSKTIISNYSKWFLSLYRKVWTMKCTCFKRNVTVIIFPSWTLYFIWNKEQLLTPRAIMSFFKRTWLMCLNNILHFYSECIRTLSRHSKSIEKKVKKFFLFVVSPFSSYRKSLRISEKPFLHTKPVYPLFSYIIEKWSTTGVQRYAQINDVIK